MKQVSTDEELWEHQEEYEEKYALVPEHVLLWQPRTGKTRAICRGMRRAILENNVYRFLITGPKAGCKEVWSSDEIPRLLATLPPELRTKLISLIDIPILTRKQIIDNLVAERHYRIARHEEPQVEIIVVNRDALHHLKKQLIAWNPQYFIIDELHKFKHAGSLRSRTAFELSKRARYRRGLTGTPASRDYRDIYGQWKVIAPRIFGTDRDTFDKRYCIFPPGQWGTKPDDYRNVEELKEKAFSIATIVFRKNCFDMPQEQDVLREITLPKAAREAYNSVANQHILELENAKVPMTHTLSRMMQLRHIAIGYARYDNDSQEREAKWLHTAKIESVGEDVDDVVSSGQKVIVFHSFLLEGYALQNHLKSLGIEAKLINGKAPRRSEVIHDFNYGDLQCVIVQEETASESISLAAADYTTFLSHGPDAGTHQQASDRSFKQQNAEGTVSLTRTYHRVRGTIEVSLFNMVKQKLSLQEQLLSGPIAQTFRDLVMGLV